jgi:hypothetical protein
MTIVTNSPYINIIALDQRYVSNLGQSSGYVRYNTSIQSFEVYDGVNWITKSDTYNIELSEKASAILRWAENKMCEESRLEKLAETNLTIKSALDTLKQAKQQLSVLEILVTTNQN